MEFHGGPLTSIPDDLTIPQFFLEGHHVTRPIVRKPSPWYIDGSSGRELYLDEIRARVHALANSLRLKSSIGDDDVVCIYSPNHIEYPVVIWAAHRVGAIITTANPAFSPAELEHVLRISRARVIVAHPSNLPTALTAAKVVGIPDTHVVLIEAAPSAARRLSIPFLIEEGLQVPLCYDEKRLKPGEAKTKIAFLCFSSGTSGKPKAVRISHYGSIANCVQLMQRVREMPPDPDGQPFSRVGDVFAGVLPFFHIFGLVALVHFAAYSGGSLVILPKFDPQLFLGCVQRHKISFLFVAPPIVAFLAKHSMTEQYDLSSVRIVMCSAAPLSPELTDELTGKFPEWLHIGQAFGMTEIGVALTAPCFEKRPCTPGSSGRLLGGFSARIVKEDGSVGRVGERGELVVKGPSIALGYLDDEEATRSTFKDGWLYTGDEALFNEDHELLVVDRIKELIKVSGFQVSPAELEGHLLAHPLVAEACVVGAPHARTGEAPCAFVVLEPGARERIQKDASYERLLKADIAKYVADAKIHYKHLTGGVRFVEAIPKNASGKVLRRVLREQAKEIAKETPAAGRSKL